MTALDHSQRAARIVNELVDRVVDQPQAFARQLYVEDFLALAASLKAAGYPVGDEVERIETINAAVERMLAGQTPHSLDGVDLMTTDPAEIAERVRQTGIDRACYLEVVRQRDGLQHQLARSAADGLAARADDIVKAMRKRWDPAVKVVQTAAERGLTQHTDTTQLLDTGSPAVIAAYRALGPAVADLDAVAGLRNQMTSVAHVGPTAWPMAAFVTGVRTADDLDGAGRVWSGESEIVQYDLVPGSTGFGTHLARIRKARLGGPWLALVGGGYTLRLNTGAEAQAVADAAMRGGQR